MLLSSTVPATAARRSTRRFSLFLMARVLIVVVYAIIYIYFRDQLPEKWSIDSEKIMEIMSYRGVGGALDNSFAVTASLFGLIGVDKLNIFTCVLSAVFLLFATHGVRRASDLFSRSLLIAPCIMLNMFAPSKETIVLLMTMLITFLS